MVVVPNMTSTIISAWADRSADAQRMNLRENRPEVQQTSARVADYYSQRGVAGAELGQQTGTVLGSAVKSQAVTHGIQSGLRFLSRASPGMGLPIPTLLGFGGAPKPS